MGGLELVRYRIWRGAVVNEVMKLWIKKKEWEFLD
jgi:hypothetical protein